MPKIGVLLVNLGTPQRPTAQAVRRFLAEFLADRRVVELPPLLWRPILHGVVLRIRPAKSAHAYGQIWTPQGSPLLMHSEALTAALRARLHARDDIRVALAMTYGQPSIAGVLRGLREEGVEQLVVLPLYPQYSGTTTASVFDRVTRELQTWRAIPALHFIRDYHDNPRYIDALAQSVRDHWRTHERGHLLLSFHGVPQRCIERGDPYFDQCRVTAQLLSERLSLAPTEWSMTFQSRFGRVEWVKPYTDAILRDYARNGPKKLTVLCPGFAVDCLETLEEIALRNRADFLAAGGERFDYVPALNASSAHVEVLADVSARALNSAAS